MRLVKTQDNVAVVQLTNDELILINNALNEVCNGLEIPELPTRIGATPDEVAALQRDFGSVLDSMEAIPS